nr:hypothetical protein CFP56_37185 [Quercus suber]
MSVGFPMDPGYHVREFEGTAKGTVDVNTRQLEGGSRRLGPATDRQQLDDPAFTIIMIFTLWTDQAVDKTAAAPLIKFQLKRPLCSFSHCTSTLHASPSSSCISILPPLQS